VSAALEIRGLAKAFGGLPAIDGVSLSVEQGERRLIIGPNGAGKTTLFNLLTGDLRADAGSIALFGQEVGSMRTARRTRLGMARTYQIITLFPGDTLAHNVMLSLLGVSSSRWSVLRPLSSYHELHERAREVLAGLSFSQEMMDGDVGALSAAACLFRGLGDPARVAILRHLALGEHRVRDLTEHLGLAQSTTSAHLACLRGCGLVQSRPEGRASVYSLTASTQLIDLLGAAERLLAVTGDSVALCPTYGEAANR